MGARMGAARQVRDARGRERERESRDEATNEGRNVRRRRAAWNPLSWRTTGLRAGVFAHVSRARALSSQSGSQRQFAAPGDLKLLPSDVQFVDVDGDTITLRGVYGGKIDYYVGKTLKLSGAILAESGGSLQITGTTKKGTPLSFLGFNLEETITDSMMIYETIMCVTVSKYTVSLWLN